MSTHAIEIIQVGEILPHPNADKMEITLVWGWSCCVGKGQFKVGDSAVYIPPDYVVPTTNPAFAFLKREGRDKERITVRRFRGQLSQGLLIPVPTEFVGKPVGTDVMEALGIERYEAPLPKSTGGNFVSAPSGLYAPKFDVENYQRYAASFTDGEEVIATEKIHGANARFCYSADSTGTMKQYCGSRTNWMDEDDKNIWWMAFRQCPAIGKWCEANPGKILYGEVFGQVQNLKYGAKPNDIFFAAFALMDKQSWVDYDDMIKSLQVFSVPSVPLVYRGPFDKTKLYALAELDSIYPGANHMREGLCVVPVKERIESNLGRVCLKIVSNRYLEKN